MKSTKVSKIVVTAFALMLLVVPAGLVIASSESSHDLARPAIKDIMGKSAGPAEHGAKGPLALKEPAGHGDKAPAAAKDPHAATGAHDAAGLTADEAFKKLLDGNKRYVDGRAKNPGRSAERRTEVAKGQHPFAVIVSCSDSRVPPEVIFDQGVGDLFVVRTAGHVTENAAIGSVEYAVEHLGARLILVLGHERCGAVDATVKGGEAPGHIRDVVEAIKPVLEKARSKHGDFLENAIKANIKMVAQNLAGAKPILAEMVEDGLVRVVGGYYDLDTGAITITYSPR